MPVDQTFVQTGHDTTALFSAAAPRDDAQRVQPSHPVQNDLDMVGFRHPCWCTGR